jgi:hypothetical protein
MGEGRNQKTMRRQVSEREVLKVMLLSFVEKISEKQARALLKKSEQLGSVLVLEIGRKPAKIGWQVSGRARVDSPMEFVNSERNAATEIRTTRRNS